MGMAARIGDMTAHGGSVVVGMPNVLIGGKPAARLGDMHVCPMVTPGIPPIPHVGGPILLGSAGVLIGGMPAARQGDMALCTGPPDTIASGCPTVLIGEKSAGGGAGGGAGVGAGGIGSTTKGATISASIASITQKTVDIEDHLLNVSFIDKAKLPIAGYGYTIKGPDNITQTGNLAGNIKRKGIPQGDYEITLFGIVNTQWSKSEARDGNTVKLIVDVINFDSECKASFSIFARGCSTPDVLIDTIDNIAVSNNRAEAEWELKFWEENNSQDSSSSVDVSSIEFFFKVNIGELTEISPILKFKDYIEIELVDDYDNPIGGVEFKATLPNNVIHYGTLNPNGYAKIENVPPGAWDVEFIGEDDIVDFD